MLACAMPECTERNEVPMCQWQRPAMQSTAHIGIRIRLLSVGILSLLSQHVVFCQYEYLVRHPRNPDARERQSSPARPQLAYLHQAARHARARRLRASKTALLPTDRSGAMIRVSAQSDVWPQAGRPVSAPREALQCTNTKQTPRRDEASLAAAQLIDKIFQSSAPCCAFRPSHNLQNAHTIEGPLSPLLRSPS